jgi:galactokinase/mevalonate kinase-like predicted kinase
MSDAPVFNPGQPNGNRIIRAKAPVRISFAGGGTDFEHWFNERPGAVLCSTICRYARVTLYPRADTELRIRSVDLGYSECERGFAIPNAFRNDDDFSSIGFLF